MNMLTGRVDEADGGRFVTGDGVALPPAPAARRRAGRVRGLRPPAGVDAPRGDVPLKVEVVEPTGSETHVMGRIGATAVDGVFRERVLAIRARGSASRVDAARDASLRRHSGVAFRPENEAGGGAAARPSKPTREQGGDP